MRSGALPFVWYPAGMALAIVMYALMLTAGTSTAAAVYAPVVLVALAIVVLELRFPSERRGVRHGGREGRRRVHGVRSGDRAAGTAGRGRAGDCAVAARARARLAVAARVAAGGAGHGHGADRRFLPVLVASCLPPIPPLWRLHEVHHSPEILYALNVGRFHPLEKVLHFGVDTVPFLLLGVAPEVIGGYFLLYAVNGLFQHSNVRLRYGWLNHVVGSAETHRWHHARDPKTASCNFGNTTLVWDHLFGTWHLPSGQAVDDIGIMDKAYPKDFLTQMRAPFRRLGGARPRRLKTLISDLLIPLQLRLTHLSSSRRIAVQVRDPMNGPVRGTRAIDRGKPRHDVRPQARLRRITSYEDFRQRVRSATTRRCDPSSTRRSRMASAR
jgi:hypothetical protein